MTVQNDGTPRPPAMGSFASGVQLSFYPAQEANSQPGTTGMQPQFASVQDDGHFEVQLPKEKYVAVVQFTPKGPGTLDVLEGRFSYEKSPITVEVTGELRFDIELENYK